MAAVALLLRILAAFLVARLALRFVANVLKGLRGEAERAPASLVRDRICNTFLPRDRAVEAVITGKPEHFCSVACRDQAIALAAAR